MFFAKNANFPLRLGEKYDKLYVVACGPRPGPCITNGSPPPGWLNRHSPRSKKERGNNMNKTELIAAVAAKTEFSKKDTEKVLSALLDTVTETLAKGEKVQLVGFGTFETKEREARTAKNPRTLETINVPATRVPGFKAGQALKAKVAK